MTQNEKLGLAALVLWFLWKKPVGASTVNATWTDPTTGQQLPLPTVVPVSTPAGANLVSTGIPVLPMDNTDTLETLYQETGLSSFDYGPSDFENTDSWLT